MLRFKNESFSDVTEEGIITGFASKFRSTPDSDGDIIVKGAYKKTLSENKDRIKFLWQHRMDQPLGKMVEIIEDESGVPFTAKISNTKLGQDAKTLIKDGVLNEFSVGFIPMKEDYKDGVNYIKEIKLFEVSLVTLAADDQATMTGYKSKFKSADDLVNEFDRLISISKKLEADDSRIVIEYELLKLKNIVTSLNLFQKPSDDTKELEIAEAKLIMSAIDKFNKKIKNGI
jgi:HK97 family phage prohead protease